VAAERNIYFLFFYLILKTNKPVEPGMLNSLQRHVIDTPTLCQ